MKGKYSTSGLHCVDYKTIERSYHVSQDMKAELIHTLNTYHNTDNIVLFNSGFWALVATLKIKLKKAVTRGVLMPSLTYRRLADVVYWAGGIPIFADVDQNTLALCPENVSSILRSRGDVGLVLLVQPIVGSVSVQQMKSVCESANVELVVDSVESVHDTIQGARTGSFPVSEVFSVHASKFINGFEGGYVAAGCYDEKVALENFRDLNARFSLDMTKFHAHIAGCNLKAIDKFVRHNKEIYEQYLHDFLQHESLPISIKAFPPEEQCGFKNIVAISEEPGMNVGHLCQYLNSKGIEARQHYQPPLHLKNYSYEVRSAQEFSVTENLGPKLINLPCGWRFDKEDVQFIIRNIREYYEAR